MSKHTPGPWSINDTHGKRYIETVNDDAVAIVLRCKSVKRETFEANARLISAAPELLAALQAVLQWIDDYCETTGFDAVEKQADAAITKATGETT